jgi:Fe-S-cluster-containing hydrogenase component 2
MNKVLIVDGDRCTGCRVCELACSMARAGEFNPAMSLIHVLRNQELDVSIPAIETACDFCGRCVAWCFEDAIAFVEWADAALVRKKVRLGRFPAPMLALTAVVDSIERGATRG